MIYIITNNKPHSDHTLYFVRAPGFDMPAYLAVVNAKQIAAHTGMASPDPDVYREVLGRLEILGTTDEIRWSDRDLPDDFRWEMNIESFQSEVEGTTRGGGLEDLSRYKTIVVGRK